VLFTVNVACPLLPVIPFVVVIIELPPPWDSVTVLPLTTLLCASSRVTVMVEVVAPSAAMVVGLAVTVEVAVLGVPAVNVTCTVWVMVMESLVSLAV